MTIRQTLSCAAFLVLLPLSGAAAAPQILGLVASNDAPISLNCAEGECSAYLSAFCLQETRTAPARGTAYRPAPQSEIALLIETADGRTVRLATDLLRFSTLIGFTSVRASLPASVVADIQRRYGTARVLLKIGRGASLLPVENAGDRNPQTAEEIALATGPMRSAAERLFETSGPSSDAARITSRLINELPEATPAQIAAADRFWSENATALAAANAEGRAEADRIYRGCRVSIESLSLASLKNCLELRHADLMATTNHRFWQEAGGS